MIDENRKTLNLILGLSSEVGRKSTLQLALEQARHLIGYDKEKGVTKAWKIIGIRLEQE